MTKLMSMLVLLGAIIGLSAPISAKAAFSTDDEQNTIEVFRYASPAVVYVTNQAVVRDRYSFNLQTVPRGTGTGVIWDKNGYIITNYHVIEKANKITITMHDQSHWPAEVVGIAPSKDLAVLRIKAPKDKLQPLPLGDSGKLTVGNKVLAIGNPFGLDTTLTVGVVSALEREIKSSNQRTIRNVIQTDAAINPGNSGGPLINSNGELIGINTAIYSPSGASVGIGFAIPINTVKSIVPSLIANGRLQRPSLGIEIGPSHWARQYGVKGVPILAVGRNTPAAQAGLKGVSRTRWGSYQLGDVIIGLGSDVVENTDDLLSALEKHSPGQRVQVDLVRDGKVMQRKLKLAPPSQ
ncbi:trypsin-like serine protease [Pseudomaricurvus alkylphenolicus]|jgi:S1-C subfamily serine protease|uniref:S1C family serine protease n=1 Tax=Pseudomaricurvus alkylphenolicus TaxID=1306991 RepID=UPI00141E2BDE|nr:trypsin-like peptidase domain-containing protein [Pseudomaricurvus alkylphenolicus]NIB42907.1 trypsin-like serine protease [Pseudomaricurvus alkylphenolicus]